MKNELNFFMAHIDDFELSCLGYLIKYGKNYDTIRCIIASTWESKEKIWSKNIKEIQAFTGLEIEYVNLEFPQRKLTSSFDDVKDKMYKALNLSHERRFDIITHDHNDCHSDHTTVFKIAKGLYKFSNRFLTVYSPSSAKFSPNMWVGMSKEEYDLKKKLVSAYDINKEQSYTKLGNYLKSEEMEKFANSSYFLENFVYFDHDHYECYQILKWI
jgi:LmbE family N-acetylglucosaminyl deacetylase